MGIDRAGLFAFFLNDHQTRRQLAITMDMEYDFRVVYAIFEISTGMPGCINPDENLNARYVRAVSERNTNRPHTVRHIVLDYPQLRYVSTKYVMILQLWILL